MKAPAPKKPRRTFAIGQCHHRSADGQPDCRRKIVAKRANLCPQHEKIWQQAARERWRAREKAAVAAELEAARAS